MIKYNYSMLVTPGTPQVGPTYSIVQQAESDQTVETLFDNDQPWKVVVPDAGDSDIAYFLLKALRDKEELRQQAERAIRRGGHSALRKDT